MAKAIIRTAKISSGGGISGSLSHNYRERKTLNADMKKTQFNSHDINSMTDAKNAIMEKIPLDHRKNAVLCIEYLITASPDFFTSKLKEDHFFEQSKRWLEERHGVDNVVTTSIHRDETTPHMIAYVVPLSWNEKKKKDTLNARNFLGGREKLSEMQTSFHKKVEYLGLERGTHKSTASHTSIKDFYSKIENPTPKLSDVAKSIDIPESKIFESKSVYGKRVADTVWNKACDNLENIYLKSSVSDYSKLENKNTELNNNISRLNNIIGELKSEIKKIKHENLRTTEIVKKINSLPENKINAFNKVLDKTIEENNINRFKEFVNIRPTVNKGKINNSAENMNNSRGFTR